MQTGIRFIGFVFISLILATTAGCFGLGPHVLPGNRVAYNRSLQTSESQQLLLNLVRMRYDESPFFLGVNSIAATMRINARAAGEYQNTVGGGVPAIDQITGASEFTYEDRPVITYSPLQGMQFSHEMLVPLSVSHISMLIESGWSPERVLRITALRIANTSNAVTATRPSARYATEYRNFAYLAGYINALNLKGVIDIRGGLYHKINSLEIEILNPQGHTAEIRKLYTMLNVRGMPKRIELVPPVEKIMDPNNIAVNLQARSFIGVMYYLSKGVEVQPAEIQKGIVVVPNYNRYSWQNLTNGIIKVKSATTRPASAFVAVFYRNRWFYIDDADDNSKQTLALLEQLFYLQLDEKVNEAERQAPVLTLPV